MGDGFALWARHSLGGFGLAAGASPSGGGEEGVGLFEGEVEGFEDGGEVGLGSHGFEGEVDEGVVAGVGGMVGTPGGGS